MILNVGLFTVSQSTWPQTLRGCAEASVGSARPAVGAARTDCDPGVEVRSQRGAQGRGCEAQRCHFTAVKLQGLLSLLEPTWEGGDDISNVI